MKFFLSIITIGIVAFIAGLYFPWWSIAIVAFCISFFINQQPLIAFLSGFLGIFLMWAILASIINSANGGILATRIAGMFGLGTNQTLLIISTAVIGGIVGGFSSLAASFLRRKN